MDTVLILEIQACLLQPASHLWAFSLNSHAGIQGVAGVEVRACCEGAMAILESQMTVSGLQEG